MNREMISEYLDNMENKLSELLVIDDFDKFMVLLTEEMQKRYGEKRKHKQTGFSLFPEIPTV